MHKKVHVFWGKKNYFSSLLFSVILLLGYCSIGLSQTKNNLDVFFSLVDSASNNIIQNLPSKNKPVKINFDSGNDYSVFTNRVLENFKSKGIKIIPNNLNGDNSTQINFTVVNAHVHYNSMFRKNLLGEFYLDRNIILTGNYSILDSSSLIKKFNYSSVDTVSYDSLSYIQNYSYPFTKGETPAEPFISSFWEPVVAIGATAVAVILFFTIRSK